MGRHIAQERDVPFFHFYFFCHRRKHLVGKSPQNGAVERGTGTPGDYADCLACVIHLSCAFPHEVTAPFRVPHRTRFPSLHGGDPVPDDVVDAAASAIQ